MALADSVCVRKLGQEYFLLLSSVGLCARPTPPRTAPRLGDPRWPVWRLVSPASHGLRWNLLLRGRFISRRRSSSISGPFAKLWGEVPSGLSWSPASFLPRLQIPFAQLTAWVWLFDHVAPRSRPWVAEHEARGHRRESGRERGQPQGAQRPRRDWQLRAGRDESSPGHGPRILVDGRPAGPCDTGGHEACGGSAAAWPRRHQDPLGSMTPHFPPPGPPTAALQMTPLQLRVKGQVCT